MKVEWMLTPAANYSTPIQGVCSINGRMGTRSVDREKNGHPILQRYIAQRGEMAMTIQRLQLKNENLTVSVEYENRANADAEIAERTTSPHIRVFNDRTRPIIATMYLQLREISYPNVFGGLAVCTQTYMPLLIRDGTRIEIDVAQDVVVEEVVDGKAIDGNLYPKAFDQVPEFEKLADV